MFSIVGLSLHNWVIHSGADQGVACDCYFLRLSGMDFWADLFFFKNKNMFALFIVGGASDFALFKTIAGQEPALGYFRAQSVIYTA